MMQTAHALQLHGDFSLIALKTLLNNGILVGKCGDKLLVGDHLFHNICRLAGGWWAPKTVRVVASRMRQ